MTEENKEEVRSQRPKKKGDLEGSKCYCEFKIKQVINYPHKSGQWRGLERESTLESTQEGMVKEEAETSIASYFEETFLRKGRKIKQQEKGYRM